MVNFVQHNNILYFDLFGGEHSYNIETKTYRIKRPYGIFSNLTVSIYAIFSLEKNGYAVEDIEFILDEYINEVNIYDDLFEKQDKIKINLSLFPKERIEYFTSRCFPTVFGLSHEITKLDLEITNQIIEKFFLPNKKIKQMLNSVVEEKNLDLTNTVFIWARKTDKVQETRIPSVDDYLEILNTHGLTNKKLIIQTDDYSVLKEFESKNIEFSYLDKIPFSMDSRAFHGRLDQISDEMFYNKYQITKIEYISWMVVSSLIAKKCNYCVVYPGNPTTFIPMIKNTYENCFLFKDNKNYYKGQNESYHTT